MGLRAAALATLLLLPSCESIPGYVDQQRSDLRDWMSGTWTAQAEDESGTVLDVRLVVVPIWKDRWDAPWLYAEQALAARPENPYRQRVYHIRSDPKGGLWCDVFDVPRGGPRLAGAWREREPFSNLRPEDLIQRTGCGIRLLPHSGRFKGSTEEKSCLSEFRGARWAMYELTVEPERMESWERGYDADGRQVWGPSGGPDVYRKVSPKPPAE